MTSSSRYPTRIALGLSLVVLLASAPVGAQRGQDSIRGLDGGSLTTDELASGDSVPIFWPSWPPRSRDIVDKVNPILARCSDRAGVAPVNFQESPEEIRAFLADKRLRAPVYVDDRGAFSRRRAVTDLPGLVIYKAGQVVYRGKLPADPGQLIQQHLG